MTIGSHPQHRLLQKKNNFIRVSLLLSQKNLMEKADPSHFGTDPDPDPRIRISDKRIRIQIWIRLRIRIFVSDLQDGN
jgi:hypothetical protein